VCGNKKGTAVKSVTTKTTPACRCHKRMFDAQGVPQASLTREFSRGKKTAKSNQENDHQLQNGRKNGEGGGRRKFMKGVRKIGGKTLNRRKKKRKTMDTENRGQND